MYTYINIFIYVYIYVNRAWQAPGVNTSFNLGGGTCCLRLHANTIYTFSTIMTFGLKHSRQKCLA